LPKPKSLDYFFAGDSICLSVLSQGGLRDAAVNVGIRIEVYISIALFSLR